MEDNVQEKALEIEGRASKISKRGRKWRAAQTAGRRDVFRQVNGIHAAARHRLMRILHQPDAVVVVHNRRG